MCRQCRFTLLLFRYIHLDGTFLFDLRYYVLSARVTLAYRNTGGNRPLYEPPVMNFDEILEES